MRRFDPIAGTRCRVGALVAESVLGLPVPLRDLLDDTGQCNDASVFLILNVPACRPHQLSTAKDGLS